MSEQRFRELLDRYLNGTATPREREILDRFFDSYQTRADDPDLLAEDSRLRDELLHNIHLRLGVAEAESARRSISWWTPLAAVVGIFIVTYFFLNLDDRLLPVRVPVEDTFAEERTNAGQKLLTRLPDGTQVHLNSNSKISYRHVFDARAREVTLTGEAFFEVVHDGKPFIVHADGFRTEVLGTAFNVRSRAGENPEVTLVEGSVKVGNSKNKSLVLQPHQQLVISANSGEMVAREVNVLKYTSWKDNTLFFEQTTLREAIEEIEMWYAVNIDMENPALGSCAITAKYQNEPLGNVLSSFQFLLNLQITKKNEGYYIINGKGCK